MCPRCDPNCHVLGGLVCKLVPEERVEPSCPCGDGILSPEASCPNASALLLILEGQFSSPGAGHVAEGRKWGANRL